MKLNYIKSPINYTGNKFRLLKDIIPLFPKDINTFIDVFGGSGVVSLNIDANYKVYNEFNIYLYNIINEFKNHDDDYIIKHIKGRIDKFDLKKGNFKKGIDAEQIKTNDEVKEHYLLFREFLNNVSEDKALDLFTIHYYSFNNLIRHNSFNKFNVPCGGREYTDKTHKELITNACEKFKVIKTLNLDFRNLNYTQLTENDFVYFDPPYLLSSAEYNKTWNDKEELELYGVCNNLNKKHIKWAMSNMMINNNTEHTLLKKWCEDNDYTIHYINTSYSGWLQNKKNSYSSTQEVLITNY